MKELVQAATVLGYSSEPVEGSARPAMAWDKAGYLAIKKPGPKIATLKLIASEIVKARSRAAQTAEVKPSKR